MRKARVCWWTAALCAAWLAAGPASAQNAGVGAAEARQKPQADSRPVVFERPAAHESASGVAGAGAARKAAGPAELVVASASAATRTRGPGGSVNLAIGSLPGGKSITVYFEVTVDNPFPNGIAEVANQGLVSGATFADVLTDDPDTGAPFDPTATPILAAPEYLAASKTVSDAVTGNNDGQAQPGEILAYSIALTNTGNGGDSDLNIHDALPAGATLDLGSVVVTLGGGASGVTDSSSGNTLDVTVASVPGAGGSVTVDFQATVATPVPAGLEVLSNTAEISSPKTPLFDSSQADIAVDALPALTLDKDDGGVTVDPGSTVVYTLSYSNPGDQDASNVTLEDTVPAGTTFDAAASSGGWDCFDGDPEGTLCSINVGTLAGNGGSGSVDFAVEVVAPQDAPAVIDNTAVVHDDGAGSGGVPVSATDDDSTPVNDLLPPTVVNVNTLKGNGDGTLDECESVANKVSAFTVEFSESMTPASVTDVANWQVIGAGPDLDLSTTSCGPAAGDDVVIGIDAIAYNAADLEARVDLDTDPWLENGPYRLMACSGPGGISDTAGNELDGDGDYSGGDDFVRTFRIDQIDAFANGHFDCDLEDWIPVTDGGGSTIEHEPTVDLDDAGISGSAHFTNQAGNVDLSLGQCVEVGGGAIHDFSGWVLLDTPAVSIRAIRVCEFFSAPECSGAALPAIASFTTILPDVWTPFEGQVVVPPTAQSSLCQTTLRSATGSAYEAYLDDVSLDLIQSPIIFQDGFESGDTSMWTHSIP